MPMERGNITNKKKRGREGGDQVHVHGDRMDQKRTEMMTNYSNTIKKPQYHCDHEFGCVEVLDGNCSSGDEICDHHHHHQDEEGEEKEKEKEVGVFDFPWLKGGGEGVIPKGDHHEYLCLQGMGMGSLLDHQEEDTFSLYPSSLPADDTTTNSGTQSTASASSPALHHHHARDLTSSSARKTPPKFHGNNEDHHHPKLENDNHPRLSSFQVGHAPSNNSTTDQHAVEYCIWSSVLDQPLDINLNIL